MRSRLLETESDAGKSWVSQTKHQFLNFQGGKIWRNYGKEAKSKWEKIKSIKPHTQIEGYSKFVHMLRKGRGVEKLVIRDSYVLNGWPRTNFVEFFLALVRPSILELFSSVIIAIILWYAITRIYTILHISLQVSKTEELAELHWVIVL